MPPIVYLDRLDDRGAKTISTIGDQPGPIGGDGWVTISQLPTDRLQAGRHYVFFVTGKIGGIQRSGSTPSAGIMQLVLGDSAGTQHLGQVIEIGFGSSLYGPGNALPFALCVIFSSTIPDPVWGPTWPNTFPMTLSGRIYRRGDPATYSGSFQVTDLVWTWADLDAIPSTDVLATRRSVTQALTSTAASLGVGPVALPGNPGDLWVHFYSIRYRPGVGAVPAFEVGINSAGGFNVMAGGGGELGLGHTGTNVAGVVHHIGGMFAGPQLAASDTPEIRGRNAVTGTTTSFFDNFDVLSIRLTELQAAFVSASSIELGLTDWTARWPGSNRFFPLEIPAQGRTWAPWTFATGMPSSSSPIDIYLDTNAGQSLWAPGSFTRMEQSAEQVPCYASAADGIGLGDPDVQYRLAFLEVSATAPTAKTVRDVYLVTFYPVRDPDNVPPDPSDPGPPVEIVPGAEGPGVGSLLDPPLQPNAQQAEQSEAEIERLRGATGYGRSWSTFLAVRGRWSLTWGPVTVEQRDDLMAFLRANRAFRVTPPRGSLSPVVQTSKPTWQQIDARRFEVQVDVAELVFAEGT